ncbi:TetR family transcriptional regulator C-terminal domain-containing protein [Embleya scabrispora]|uniref:TetR family transcriptional regulator C-terminal domain-containing protein n=1 Tax=Embleya scabrispora TaxID=159449 RepID=UPI0003646CED|nr:TetR family transcriptional regulator [Streptomyces sp. SID5474]
MAGTRRKRLEQPREVVLQAAMDAIAEHGLAQLTMAGLGKRIGISGGHVAYYFGSKEQLLVETLRWSESGFAERRRALLTAVDVPLAERLAGYIDLYLPDERADSRWTLWLEVWTRSLADPEVLAASAEIEGPWMADLRAMIGPHPDPDGYVLRLHALLDGLATRIVIGAPGPSRAEMLRQATEFAVREAFAAGGRPGFADAAADRADGADEPADAAPGSGAVTESGENHTNR